MAFTLRCIVGLSMLASCLAGETRPSLRAASADALPLAASEPEAGAEEQGQEIGCTCTAAGACQCHRSGTSGAHAKEDEALEQALLKETREILARFQEAEGEDGPAARLAADAGDAAASAGWAAAARPGGA